MAPSPPRPSIELICEYDHRHDRICGPIETTSELTSMCVDKELRVGPNIP